MPEIFLPPPAPAAESRGRGGRKKQARRRQARHPASPEHDAKPQAAAAREPRASHTQSGGYGGGVPPLPIPNREVKPARADGTAHECGRVGCRPLQTSRPPAELSAGGRFFCAPAMALNQHVTSDFILLRFIPRARLPVSRNRAIDTCLFSYCRLHSYHEMPAFCYYYVNGTAAIVDFMP